MSEVPASPPGGGEDIDIVATAQALADEMLFPAALAIDRAPVVPSHYLDELAKAGLYGLYGPRATGGLDVDPRTGARVIEALGGGSLSTAFIWIQHLSVVRAVASARPELRAVWLDALCRGRIRAGIASGALRRADPPAVTARPAGSGWLLEGRAPWVTGWERIGAIYVGARYEDRIVWALIDAVPATTLRVRPLELAAMWSTSTVEVVLAEHPVVAQRVVDVEAFADWQSRDAVGLRTNGYLALGVASRCARLLHSAALTREIAAARDQLDQVEVAGIPEVRAGITLLTARAAAAVVVEGRSRSIDVDSHAQRLAREAMFLLVFGQTSDIRAAQLDALLVPDELRTTG